MKIQLQTNYAANDRPRANTAQSAGVDVVNFGVSKGRTRTTPKKHPIGKPKTNLRAARARFFSKLDPNVRAGFTELFALARIISGKPKVKLRKP